ncbi:MAG: glycerophosphodiester phosphodiesterase family protein [Bacteroidota bacterium]
MEEKLLFDWQGHRGARGLAPENTIPAFLKALEFPAITTLELDVVISADSQVVVSHEPWFSPVICRDAHGERLAGTGQEDWNLYKRSYAEIKAVDCGSWGHSSYPDQVSIAVPKPRLFDVLDTVISHCQNTGRALPGFNIELKSKPGWDGIYTPLPSEFVTIVLETLSPYQSQVPICIQSFDHRILREVHLQAPEQVTAFLAEKPISILQMRNRCGFTPTIYSPFHVLVSATLVQEMHRAGLKVIPWTVNETTTMESLIEMGVDGIITDYPNRIPK